MTREEGLEAGENFALKPGERAFDVIKGPKCQGE